MAQDQKTLAIQRGLRHHVIGVSIIDIGTIFVTVPVRTSRLGRSTPILIICAAHFGSGFFMKKEKRKSLRELRDEGRQSSIFKGLLRRGQFKLTLRTCLCLGSEPEWQNCIVIQTLLCGSVEEDTYLRVNFNQQTDR